MYLTCTQSIIKYVIVQEISNTFQHFSFLLEPNVGVITHFYVSWDPFYGIIFNDILVWLFLPSNSDNSLDFLYDHVVVILLLSNKFDQDRVLLLREIEFYKQLALVNSGDNVLDALKKENFLWSLSRIHALVSINSYLPEIAATLNELHAAIVRFPNSAREKRFTFHQHISQNEVI